LFTKLDVGKKFLRGSRNGDQKKRRRRNLQDTDEINHRKGSERGNLGGMFSMKW
jgi:hypothetical protein